MKTVVHNEHARDKLLHIEAEGCIINVRVGLTDNWGRKVTSIEITPDQYADDEWHFPDAQESKAMNVRVMHGPSDEKKRKYLHRYEDIFGVLMGKNMSGRWNEGMWTNAHMYFGMRTPVEDGARKFYLHCRRVMRKEGTWIEEEEFAREKYGNPGSQTEDE